MAESLLTPERAAQLLAVRPKTIRDWLKRGRLKGVRAGRLWRIRERDLEAFLAAEKETQSWLDADAGSPLPPLWPLTRIDPPLLTRIDPLKRLLNSATVLVG